MIRALVSCLVLVSAAANAQQAFDQQRAAMVAEVEEFAAQIGDMKGGFSDQVLDAMGTVERHRFVPAGNRRHAYDNRPLPIGYGQTISQPYIVALMTELVEPDDDDVVLEIGTGSGYQAAMLSGLVGQVYTIEIIPELASQARDRLERLGYGNVTTRLGDGYYGWEDAGPFDSIVVTAAANHVPPPLIRQLKRGGRMVIPVGGRFVTQLLLLIEKTEEGELVTRQISMVRFVPLTGQH